MGYKINFIRKPTYLHAIVTGENSKENVVKYLYDILQECTKRNCLKVLIEERLEGPRLGTFDVYSIASLIAIESMGKIKAVAYVDINAEGNLMHFAETVATNRSLPVKVFSTVAEAEKWLQEKGI